jgi:hypothetical protein
LLSEKMAEPPVPVARSRALKQLKDHPALPALIPRLPPGVLTRLFTAVGLNDAGSLMAITPPALLAAALDDAVWHSDRDGTVFNPDALVDWLEVWLAEGETFTATRLAALDEDVLAAGFGELVRVDDVEVLGFEHDPEDDAAEAGRAACSERFGQFLVAGERDDEWDVVGGALGALWTHEPARLLALLNRLSVTHPHLERDGAWRRLQADAAGEREARRERGGFVTPAAANAFLATALAIAPESLAAMTAYDPETRRHLALLRRIDRTGRADAGDGEPDADPAVDEAGTEPQEPTTAAVVSTTGQLDAEDDPGLWALLVESGVLEAARPVALLAGPKSAELPLLTRLRALPDDEVASAASELAYLANVLLADAAFAGELRGEGDARDLVLAMANLGIELLEESGRSVEIGREPGLVRPFLVARQVLHMLPARVVEAFEDAAASRAFAGAMARREWLAGDVEGAFETLGDSVAASRFPEARDAVLLLSLVFDRAACRAVLPLLSAAPAFPCVLEGGGADTTRWIRARDDLARIAKLLGGLLAPG